MENFFNRLKELSKHEGTHKLLEKTMFNLLKAVDEGNVVMYKAAVPSQFERERRREAAGDGDQEETMQGMAIVYKFVSFCSSHLRHWLSKSKM